MKKILKLMMWVMLLGLPVVMTSCEGLVTAFNDNPISPGLKVTTPSIQVEKGKTFKCNAKASSRTKLVYASADPSIATVDSYGMITGVAEGKTTITITTEGKDSQARSIFTIESVTIPVEVIKLDVPVKSVKLDKTTLTATLGDDPVKLVATVNPDNADFKTVEWTTSDETIVEIEDGVMTFVGAGTATITATATNGTTDAADDKTAKCEVTVNGISVTSVTLDKTELAMTVGSDDVTLTATVAPDNATDKTVTWTSDKETVATVVNGVVHAVAAGTATITAKAGAKTATCTVTVNKAAGSISYAETSVQKNCGDTNFTNDLTIVGNGTVGYTSSKTDVATVNPTTGVVTVVGLGSTTITATVADSEDYSYEKKTAAYTVTVSATFSLKKLDSVTDVTATALKVTDQTGTEITFTKSDIQYTIAPTAIGSTVTDLWFEATTATGKYIQKVKVADFPSLIGDAKLEMATIGDVILSDGTFAVPSTTGTKVAMIAYLGNDADASGTYHGLGIALADESDSKCAWAGDDNLAGVSCSTVMIDHKAFLNGIADTETLNTKYSGYAATKAKNYQNTVAAPTGTSGWFLPSSGQWLKFFGAAGVDVASWTALGWAPGGRDNWTKINTLLTTAGGAVKEQEYGYWSSSEYDPTWAIRVLFDSTNGVNFYTRSKHLVDDYVRSFLAF